MPGPLLFMLQTVNSEPVMVTGTVVGGGPSSDGKAGYGVASSSNGQAPPTYAEHVAATAQHSVIPKVKKKRGGTNSGKEINSYLSYGHCKN